MNQLNNIAQNSSFDSLDQTAWTEFLPNILAFILSSFLNIFLVIVFFCMKKFTFSNLLFLSLVISDLLFGAIEAPLEIALTILGYWPFGEALCVIQQIMRTCLLTISNLLIFIMACHRLVQLIRPFKAQETLKKKNMTFLLLSWLAPLCYAFGVILYQTITQSMDYSICDLKESEMMLFYFLVFSNVAPNVLAVAINTYNIYGLLRLYKLHRHQDKFILRRSKSSVNFISTVETNEEKRTSMTGPRRDLRAALCIFSIITSMVSTQLPFYVVTSFLSPETPGYFEYYKWSIKILFLNPLANPIILLAFHHGVRKEAIRLIKQVFCFRL